MTEAQMVNRIKELEKECYRMRDLIDSLYKSNEKFRKALEKIGVDDENASLYDPEQMAAIARMSLGLPTKTQLYDHNQGDW